jgi:hypothetical protein
VKGKAKACVKLEKLIMVSVVLLLLLLLLLVVVVCCAGSRLEWPGP